MALSLKPIQIVDKNNYQLLVKAPHWERVFLKYVAEVHNGFAFESKFFTKNKGIPLIRIRDISKEDTENYYDGDYQENYLVNKGDILIGMDGDFNVAIWQGKQGLLNQRVCRIKIFSIFYSEKFLFLCLQPYLKAINTETSSVTVKHLSSQTVEDIPLPLPPLPEQYRIVAKIEELFTQLDAGVELLKKVKAKLKRYRHAVLKAAVEGNLTAYWRTAHQGELEPASVLIERILKQRRDKWEAEQLTKMQAQGKTPKDDSWKLKYKEPVAPNTSDLPKLPDGWYWANTQQLGEVQLGRQRSPKNRSKDYPTKYIRAANITEKGLNLNDVLDMEFEPQERERYLLKDGDILLSEASGSPEQVGKPAIWRGQLPECCFQNTVIRLSSSNLSNDYLLIVFKTFYFIGIFSKIAAGVGINHLSANKFSTIAVPISPLKEQIQIVQEVERHLSIIDQLEKTIDTNLKRANKLRQTILKQAFEGKLVPQDPNDEPAEKLLERIKAEKAARESEKKSQRQPKIKSNQPRKSKKSSTQLELNLNNQNG